MGYLRGTRTRTYGSISLPTKPLPNRTSPTLANKVRRLEYLLNKQKPELQQYRANFSDPSVIGISTYDHDFTNALIADSTFRDRVLGDRWYNKKLLLKFFPADNGATTVRVIIYLPTKSTSTWSPSTNFFFTQIPDHTAFNVLHDKIYTKSHSTTRINGSVLVNLNNLLTYYDSDSGLVDSGSIKMKVIWYSTTSNPMYFSSSLYFTNK